MKTAEQIIRAVHKDYGRFLAVNVGAVKCGKVCWNAVKVAHGTVQFFFIFYYTLSLSGSATLSSLSAKISKIASFSRKSRRLIVILSDKTLTKKNKIWLFLAQKHDIFIKFSTDIDGVMNVGQTPMFISPKRKPCHKPPPLMP